MHTGSFLAFRGGHSAGAAPKVAAIKEAQPANAANGSRHAAQAASVQNMASSTDSQPAPRRVVQESDAGKARFVCCGFGGKKAGSRMRK